MQSKGRVPGIFTAAGMGALIVAFGVFFALPFVGLLDNALRDSGTWDAMTSETAVNAVVLSLITSTIALALAIVLGTPTAYWLAHSRFPGHRVLEAVLDLPILLPPTVAGVALLTAFGRRGILGEPLEDGFGLTLGFTTTAVVLAQLFVAGPFYVRSARAGFASVDGDLESIAYTLGASPTADLVPRCDSTRVAVVGRRSDALLGAGDGRIGGDALVRRKHRGGDADRAPRDPDRAGELCGNHRGGGRFLAPTRSRRSRLGQLLAAGLSHGKSAVTLRFSANLSISGFLYDAAFDVGDEIVVLFGHSGGGQEPHLAHDRRAAPAALRAHRDL